MKYNRIAVDTSKSVFTLHGIDAEERVILRGDYSRSKFQNFFKKQAPTEVVMEACGGAHHWARTLEAMGHRVKLIPARARAMMALLGKEVSHLDERLAELDKQLQEQHKATPICQLLAGIPGIGPITAQTLATKVSPGQFKSARHFAAWIGLTPRQNSSGGKQRLGHDDERRSLSEHSESRLTRSSVP